MAKYRVLTIAMCLKNNVIAKHNDVIDESQLTIAPFELISQGFIEIVEEEAEPADVAPKAPKVKAPKAEPADVANIDVTADAPAADEPQQ